MAQTGSEATESETSVRCVVTHGARVPLVVLRTAGARAGSVTQVWSVDMVVLSRIRGQTWSTTVISRRT